MPALRGLLASLGASVSLAAAGALALLAISAIIALQGWPGLGGDAEGRPVPIGGQTELGSETAEPGDVGPVVLADAPDEGGPTPTPTPTPTPAAEPVAADDPSPVADDPAPTGGTEPGDEHGDGDHGDDGVAPPPDPRAPRPEPDDDSLLALDLEKPVRGLTGLTGDVLRGTGETLSPTTDALLPGSGEAVEGLTDDLGNTVENTGATLGATLTLLLTGRA
jgi:hypothetical protein